MCLLAAFRAAEDLDDAVLRLKRKTAGVLDTNVTVAGTRKLIRQVFRQSLLKNLRNMGVYDPLKPIKSGGTIGNDTLSSISARFLGI
jgi:hypothetical protein